MNRLIIGVLGLTGIGLTALYYLGTPELYLMDHQDSDFSSVKENSNEVIILRWTKWWGMYTKSPLILTQDDCPYLHNPLTLNPNNPINSRSESVFKSCRISYDRHYFELSDAVVFHSSSLSIRDIPSSHPNHQMWVYWQGESPIYTPLNLSLFPIFNWTMTFRRDSDVYDPYGHIVPHNSPELSLSDAHLYTSKPKLLLWIVSSCESESKREELVHELQKYIPVDIYGKCGHPCKTADQSKSCYEPLENQYKFYLSFENSLCVDYITEKFFKAMNSSMVPVVFGGNGQWADDYAAIAPKHSYIDSRHFKNAEVLANYLLHLDKHDDEYLTYLEWKLTHKVVYGQGWCNLCQKVFSQRQEQKEKEVHTWYTDLGWWWNHQSYQNGNGMQAIERNGDNSEVSACVLSESFNKSDFTRYLPGLPANVSLES